MMGRPHFNNSDPTWEASHWTSLALGKAEKIAQERIPNKVLTEHPEFTIEIAKMIMAFVTAKESMPSDASMLDIASAIRELD